ncbi:MAG: hypothetical protein ACREXU_15665 [Gammaproteobacteria bacterium]
MLRGRARLLEAEIDSAARALDDAEEALRLARDCGYAWAECDALFLEADTRAALSTRHGPDNASAATREREASRRARADAEALAARLVLSEEDLAAADAKTLEWLKDWEKNARNNRSRAFRPNHVPWGICLATETASLAIYAFAPQTEPWTTPSSEVIERA